MQMGKRDLREHLLEVQQELFDCGSDLAFVRISETKYKVRDEMVTRLEQWIDQYDAENPKVERFISQAEACFHLHCMCAVPYAAGQSAVQ